MVVRVRLVNLVWVVCLATLSAAAETGNRVPDLNTIVQRMQSAQREDKASAKPYTVRRDYQILDKSQETKAQVIANISFFPPDRKEAQIESSHGGMGEKVLRDVIAHETQPPRDAARTEITPSNYHFELRGTSTLNGRDCYLLGMKPLRDDKELIKGQMWVDAETYHVLRVEGTPAKSPSWWIRDLYILMSFGEIEGNWMPTFTKAIANVRFKGRYEMVAHDLEYRAGTVHTAHRRHSPGILAGSAIQP
jgi:outer membrane lipoprotein-sorting protein